MKPTVRSEWTKFISSSWCVAGASIALLLQPILLLVGLAATANPTSSLALEQMLQALYVSQVGMVIMSAGFFGQEYFDSSLRTTFLANSRRNHVLMAKVLILAAVSMLVWIVSVGLGLVIALSHNVYFPICALIRITFTMSSWIKICWISGFIAVILKSHIISMAVIIPLLLAVNQLLVVIAGIFRFLPDAATRNVFTIYPSEMFLEVRAGMAVQAIWVAALGACALWLNARRDVK